MVIAIFIVFALIGFIVVADIAIIAMAGKISSKEYEKLERPDLIRLDEEE